MALGFIALGLFRFFDGAGFSALWLATVTPETPVADAWEVMGRENVSQLPVVSGGRLEGLVSLDRVLQTLRARGETRP